MSVSRWWAVKRLLLFVFASGWPFVFGEPLVLSVAYGLLITALFSLQTILGLGSDDES